MTPILSLLLVHDQFFSKPGIAAPSAHPLRLAIERHKARLQAEFTRARLRRKCSSVVDLKTHLLVEKPPAYRSQPRWVRINTLKTTLSQELDSVFGGYRSTATLNEVAKSDGTAKVLAVDHNIPELIALPPGADVTKTEAYRDGRLILQDKASCFPAFLLVGEKDDLPSITDCVDGCAAPGNKTSHLAALLHSNGKSGCKIHACERDPKRSKILQTMMQRSGADTVMVHAACDFLKLDPHESQYRTVTHLLLDPSCSGSGIIGREDVPSLMLPVDPKAQKTQATIAPDSSRKRKRNHETHVADQTPAEDAIAVEETREAAPDSARLQRLSHLQAKIVEHALSFPAARRVAYSTCSVHAEENEAVVAQVLVSASVQKRGWRLLRREEQVPGLRVWQHRGIPESNAEGHPDRPALTQQEREACIRCHPGDAEGTMGFFVCCFVRAPAGDVKQHVLDIKTTSPPGSDSWEGFTD